MFKYYSYENFQQWAFESKMKNIVKRKDIPEEDFQKWVFESKMKNIVKTKDIPYEDF